VERTVLTRLDPAQIRHEPFPHVVAQPALDPAWYDELEAAYPSFESVLGARSARPNRVYARSAREVLADPDVPQVWRDFFAAHVSKAFLRASLAFWAGAIAREMPDLERRLGRPLGELSVGIRAPGQARAAENLATDFVLDVQFSVNSPAERLARVRGPHVDRPEKLLASLLYFRHPDDPAAGGDLDLLRLRAARYAFDDRLSLDDAAVERFDTVRYGRNVLVSWLNTERSLHAVTPRAPSPVIRRYVNLIVESYRVPGGFFPIRRSRLDRARTALRHALGLGDGGRRA
jgi:hypothetical protein